MPAEPVPPVEVLIPHRGPSLFLRRVVEMDHDRIECIGVVPADNAFAAGALAPSFVGIDLVAQAAGALEALRRRREHEAAPGIGYLVGIREARFETSALPTERPLRAEVRRVGGAGALITHEARLLDQDASCLWAVVTTFVPAADTEPAKR